MTFRRLTTISASMFTAAVLSLAVATPISAQNTTRQMDGMKLSNDEPIQIESDQLEIKEQEKTAYFTGNVKVVQGATTMRAGKMRVLYTGEGASMTSGNTDIDKIFLDETVFLSSGEQKATADKGEFNMASQTFVLTGDEVVLSEGQNVFKGCKLTVRMETGEAKLDSCGGRVEILLDPKSRQQQ